MKQEFVRQLRHFNQLFDGDKTRFIKVYDALDYKHTGLELLGSQILSLFVDLIKLSFQNPERFYDNYRKRFFVRMSNVEIANKVGSNPNTVSKKIQALAADDLNYINIVRQKNASSRIYLNFYNTGNAPAAKAMNFKFVGNTNFVPRKHKNL